MKCRVGSGYFYGGISYKLSAGITRIFLEIEKITSNISSSLAFLRASLRCLMIRKAMDIAKCLDFFSTLTGLSGQTKFPITSW